MATDRLFESASSSNDEQSPMSVVAKGLRRKAREAGSISAKREKQVFYSSSSSEPSPASMSEHESPVIVTAPVFEAPPIIPFPTANRSISFTATEESPKPRPTLQRKISRRDELLPSLGDSKPSLSPARTHDTSLFSYDVVDFVFFYVHGIGGTEETLNESLRRLDEMLTFVKEQWFWPVNCEMKVELINWKNAFSEEQESIFEKIKPVKQNKNSHDRLSAARHKLNITFADILYYMVPNRRAGIIRIVADRMNQKMAQMRAASPSKYRNSKIVLIGYSLGSVILHDLLMMNLDPASTVRINFPVHALYLLGSPLSVVLSVRNELDTPPRLTLPHHVQRYYNIYDPNDPVAFRQEPLFFGDEVDECAPAVLLPVFDNPSNEKRPADQLQRFDEEAVPLSGMLAYSRRLDYSLNVPLAGDTMSSLMPAVALAAPMMQAHASYTQSRDVGLFIWRSLTGFDPAIQPERNS